MVHIYNLKKANLSSFLHKAVSLRQQNENIKEWHDTYKMQILNLKESMTEWLQNQSDEKLQPSKQTKMSDVPELSTDILESSSELKSSANDGADANKSDLNKAEKKNEHRETLFVWSMWNEEDLSRYLLAGVISRREILANIRKCPFLISIH